MKGRFRERAICSAMVLFPQPAGPVTSHMCCSVGGRRPLGSDPADPTTPLGFAAPEAMGSGRRAVFGEEGLDCVAVEMSVDDGGACPLTGIGVSQESMIKLCVTRPALLGAGGQGNQVRQRQGNSGGTPRDEFIQRRGTMTKARVYGIGEGT